MKTLALFFALVAPCFARLGETVAECKARYGEPVHIVEKTSAMHFSKAGFRLVIEFYKGRAAGVMIEKEAEPGVLQIGNPEISKTEIDTFLQANSGGGEWVENSEGDFVNVIWFSKGGRNLAVWQKFEHTLSFMTKEYLDHRSAQKAQEEKEKLGDF